MPISKRNRRGLAFVLIIGVIIAYSPRILLAAFDNPMPEISFKEAEKIEHDLSVKKIERQKEKKSHRVRKYKRPERAFDPNGYATEDWKKLGLSDKQSEVIVKFSKRGLTSNADLERIFVLPKALFQLIKDSTVYPEIKITDFENREEEIVKEVVILDLNSATKEELIALRGIGNYFAAKIVEHREELGGYSGIHQLLEIWKFDAEKLNQIKENISVDVKKIQKININSANLDELKSHPYIEYKVANSIVKMRAVNGNYVELNEIIRSKLIDQELFNKLKPYLTR
ncbi:MAG: helix-hairpin-helix domain-containing protein [Crocinitomicaceae bacterium]|nr:helix-hairpin-helix domain-containing protein [Crocinitomicaceae bacterium]